MNGHQTWYNFFFEKLPSLGGVLAKFNKCNEPDKHVKLVPSSDLLDRNHIEPQNKKYHVRRTC